MKKTYLSILLLFYLMPPFALGQLHSIESFITFESGQQYIVFGDNVKLRSGPGTQYSVIKLMRIGEKLEIIKETKEHLTYNGINSRWYKVKSGANEGYMLGGLIAIKSFVMDGFTLLSSLKQAELYKPQLVLRVLSGSHDYTEFIFNLPGNKFELKLHNSRGLSGIKNLLEADYFSEACGEEGGSTYFYWNGNSMHHLAHLSNMAEAGMFSTSEKFIFPDDESGIKNSIVYKKSTLVVEDETTNWFVKTEESRVLSWDGKILSPKPPFK